MKKYIGSLLGNVLSMIGVALTPEQIENTEHVMSIICMVLGLLITIITAVIIPLIKWWKEAKKDGKIDDEEKEEGKNIFLKLIEIIKNFFKNIKKKGD